MSDIGKNECMQRDDAEWDSQQQTCEVESGGWYGTVKQKAGSVKDRISR